MYHLYQTALSQLADNMLDTTSMKQAQCDLAGSQQMVGAPVATGE